MRLTLLGTGGPLPAGDRFQAGYLLEADARVLLVDCGSGVLHRLARTEPGYAGIDAVLLTHHHLDHVADLLGVLKARWLVDAPELPVYGPPGTRALLDGLLEPFPYLADEIAVTATDVGPDVREVAGWSVRAMETAHSMQCFAYRFSETAADGDGDGVGDVTLSGDTEAMAELAAFAEGSAVLVHDCSFPDDIDVSNHPTPSQLGAALAGTEIDRVVLTHLYPYTRGHETAMREAIAARFDGRVDILPDLSAIDVGAPHSSE